MGMTTIDIMTVSGPKRVAVVRPTRALELTPRTLDELPWSHPKGAILRYLWPDLQPRKVDADAIILTFQPDETATLWSFGNDLDASALHELAETLLTHQLPLYRDLVAAGVGAVFHCGIAMSSIQVLRAAMVSLTGRKQLALIEATDDTTRRSLELDTWILKYFLYFYAFSVEWFVTHMLAAAMAGFTLKRRLVTRLLEPDTMTRDLTSPQETLP